MNWKRVFLAEKKERIKQCFTKEQIGDCPVLDEAELRNSRQQLCQTEVIFSTWDMPKLTAEEIRTYVPKLKAVFYAAGTVHYFAKPYLELGIRVCSGWAANAVPVAEFAAAQIVLAGKGYFQLHRRYRVDGYEASVRYAREFRGNYGTNVGILGAGMIGRHVIRLLKPYDLHVLVYDPYLTDKEAEAIGVKTCGLEEIFTVCQTISNHMPNLPETKQILTYELFSNMKKNGIFINTGRGAQVCMDGLLRAMKEEPERTALLDVTDPSEPLTALNPIWDLDNVFLSPHRAGAYTDEIYRIGMYMWQEYERFEAGLPLQYEVTEKRLKTMA